ncbi:magnesium transporter [Mycoplasma corogypsi]|uniref:magnesium transporter n=1 Tax=Mycoplasma corogypsi TaxID=2106 RepID=UPI003873C30E
MEFTETLRENLVLQLKELVWNKSVKNIRELEDEYPKADFAETLEELDSYEQLYILRVLKTDTAAEVFSYLEDDTKAKLASSFSEEWGTKILQELQSDELADILEDLPANITRRILAETNEDKRSKINAILQYSDDQVGSMMSVDISIIQASWTTKKALKEIRHDYRQNKEFSHNFYVVDEQGRLLGDITLEELVFNDEDQIIDELYNVVTSVHPYDNKLHAAQIFSDHDRSTVAVVNKDNFLIGMITSDDVIDVIQEQATEDMYKMAGINPEAAEESYLKTKIWQIVKSRTVWLIILMLSATISQYIIQAFTELSEHFIQGLGVAISTSIIVALIPIISGSAGNAGSQSSTTITRASALGEIEKQDIWRVVLKEMSIGAIIGSIMFAVNVVRLYIYFSIPGFRGLPYEEASWTSITFIILASSLSLLIVVVFAKFLGTMIPLVAIRFKKDPAVMSAPILATLSDALSTLIFFGLNIGVLAFGNYIGLI